ncbi:glycosyltransferase family 4 protein [Endozoicomonas acroporae]|uniref:glycosyltransferase family 4 protein n=1 Tax=Endozoicomonas acroporae TaxID=1701104 RepID=UPI003D7ADC91
MKTICFSANTSWYLYNFERDTILELIKRGFQVCCIAPRDDYSVRLVEELGVIYIQLDMDNSGNHPGKDLKTAWDLLKSYRQCKPLVAFQFTIKNNIYGTLAARVLGVPVVNNISGLGTAFIHPGWVGRIVRSLYRISQPFAYQVFCQNSDDYELLISRKLITSNKLKLLPGAGVDIKRFRPVKQPTVNDRFQFLYVGRMLGDKGLRELVEAYAMLKSKDIPAELKLVGFADAKNKTAIPLQELQSWQKQNGIEWLGASDTIEEVLAQADCVVLPSYREGLPVSLLEACAMALPVIATDVPGCRSVVTHYENGLLCKPKDPVSLYEAMLTMFNLPDHTRLEMGQKGREHVTRNYCKSLVIDAYVKVVERLAHEEHAHSD